MNGTFPLWTYWTDGNHITRFKIQETIGRELGRIWSDAKTNVAGSLL
jgi:hypothetical protein